LELKAPFQGILGADSEERAQFPLYLCFKFFVSFFNPKKEKKEIFSLSRARATIYKYQNEKDPQGIRWSHLLKLVQKEREMSRQTFSKRLRGLLKKNLVETEKILGLRGNPTLYRINSTMFAELAEFWEMSYPGYIENEIESFAKEIESFETDIYIEAMMELALGRLYVLPISLMLFKTEGARWLFYEENYKNIEKICRYILTRASQSSRDCKQTLNKIFEFLEPLSIRPIGKRLGLDILHSGKEEILKVFSQDDQNPSWRSQSNV
jgi:hypothetical protein